MCQHSETNNLLDTCFQKQSNVWNKAFKNKCKRPSRTKQMNRVQNIRIEI